MKYYHLRLLENGCYRIVEVVGEVDGVSLTIDWPGLYETKRGAVLAIEAELRVKFTEDEWKSLMFRVTW